MRMTALLVALAVAVAALASDPPEVRRTKVDLRALSTSAEAYFTDHGEYPQAKTLEDLRAKLSPDYLKTVPMTDGWGTPFAYRAARGRDGHYRVVSAGPDRKFDPSSLDLNKRPAKSDDIIYADVGLIH
ncbi:MAG TPA: type II secretion system protein GspG [Thermoanaerobaculia bacterium]|nr:type II secretion system protein GspG [Thermoanaerobaculia bacterium]